MNAPVAFRLAGRAGPVFATIRAFAAAGSIPSVTGLSRCGGFMTTARIADVVPVEPEPKKEPRQ